MSNDEMREEFEAWYLSVIVDLLGKGVREHAEKNLSWKRDDGSYADPALRLALMAWEASRLASGAVPATAWRVVDAKGKRFTVYNKDLAIAIADAGLSLAPMCEVPPEGWECSRHSGHEGPCAAYEVNP